jgi:thiol-disulfide isomerase/thioredoxin
MKILSLILLLFLLFNISYSQELLPANEKVLDSIKQANKGKVILINFWASWCKPCTEEFPDLLEINNEYKDKDFKIVFGTLDFGDDLTTKTKKFLKKNDVDFITYSNGFAKDEDLINYMDKNWEGAIPGTFIYDKNGKLSKTFIGKRNYEDFKEVIDKYLM